MREEKTFGAKMLEHRIGGEKGFSLMELMVVVAIIGILAAVAVPNFMRSREKGKFSACVETMRILHEAAASYEQDQDSWEDFTNGDVVCRYVTHTAQCDATMLDDRIKGSCTEWDNWASRVVIANEDEYQIETELPLKEARQSGINFKIIANPAGVYVDRDGIPLRPKYICAVDTPVPPACILAGAGGGGGGKGK